MTKFIGQRCKFGLCWFSSLFCDFWRGKTCACLSPWIIWAQTCPDPNPVDPIDSMDPVAPGSHSLPSPTTLIYCKRYAINSALQLCKKIVKMTTSIWLRWQPLSHQFSANIGLGCKAGTVGNGNLIRICPQWSQFAIVTFITVIITKMLHWYAKLLFGSFCWTFWYPTGTIYILQQWRWPWPTVGRRRR